MSVTFYIETPVSEMHSHHGPCGVESCEDNEMFMGYCAHVEAAEEACGCKALDVNLSNTNASSVLGRLGYDEIDLLGSADADDFLGRAMVANVGRDDSGLRSETYHGARGATVIECGQRPGYYDDVMQHLIALATQAGAQDRKVAWS